MPQIPNDLLNETLELLQQMAKVIDEDRIILKEYLKSASGPQNYNLKSQIELQDELLTWLQKLNDRFNSIKE